MTDQSQLPLLYTGVEARYAGSELKAVQAQVDRVQILLAKRNGLDSDTFAASRDYDETTEGLILGFQKANGLQMDGVIGPETESALNAAEFLLFVRELKATNNSGYADVVSGGGTDPVDVVLSFQKLFNKANKASIAANTIEGLEEDGVFGSKTLAALRAEVKRLIPGSPLITLELGEVSSPGAPDPEPPPAAPPLAPPPAVPPSVSVPSVPRTAIIPQADKYTYAGGLMLVENSSGSSDTLVLAPTILTVAGFNEATKPFTVKVENTVDLLIDFGGGNSLLLKNVVRADKTPGPDVIEQVEIEGQVIPIAQFTEPTAFIRLKLTASGSGDDGTYLFDGSKPVAEIDDPQGADTLEVSDTVLSKDQFNAKEFSAAPVGNDFLITFGKNPDSPSVLIKNALDKTKTPPIGVGLIEKIKIAGAEMSMNEFLDVNYKLS